MKRGFLKNKTAPRIAPTTDSKLTIVNLESSRPVLNPAPPEAPSDGYIKRGFLKNKVAPLVKSNVAPHVVPTADPKLTMVDSEPSKPVLIPHSPEAPATLPPPTSLDGVNLAHFNLTNLASINIPTVCVFYPGTKDAFLRQFQPIPCNTPLSMPFYPEDIPGQGRGVVARNVINAGDTFWDEYPFLVVPMVISAGLPKSTLARTFKTAIDNFPPYMHPESVFYCLHNCKSQDPRDIMGIIDTNAFGIGSLPGPYQGEYAALFAKISFVNHNCVPNTLYKWNPKTFSSTLTALRPIAAGEQICISYLSSPFLSRAKRQAELLSKYAFTCNCASCALPKNLSARSDVKRQVVFSAVESLPKVHQKHESVLKDWIADRSLSEDHLLKPARFLMQLMEEEKAFDLVLWLSQAELACKALCALGDRAGVVGLARKASVFAKAELFGNDAGWSKVADAPERTTWWGLRKKD